MYQGFNNFFFVANIKIIAILLNIIKYMYIQVKIKNILNFHLCNSKYNFIWFSWFFAENSQGNFCSG